MSLLYMDSCDFYATADLPMRWLSVSGATISPGTGRRGTNSLRLADSGVIDIAPGGDPKAIICGFAYRTALAAGPVWYLFDPVNVRNQVLIAQGTDGRLSALRGGAAAVRGDPTGAVTLGTSSSGLTANTYAYVEIQVRLDPTAGSVVVHVDRVEVLNLQNVNTVNSGGGYFTIMGFRGAGAGNNDVDDVYVCDPTGPGPWNALLGDCQVDVRRPIAAGANSGWIPTGGPNWQNVADAAPDADATYNTANLIGAVDTYALQPVPVGVTTILGVQHNLCLRKTDTAACVVAPVVSRAGVISVSEHQFAPDLAFAYARHVQSVNPATGRLWIVGDLNAAEFGVKRLA